MHRHCMATLGCFLAVALWCAAGYTPVRAQRANSLEPGSWSLQFQVSDNIGLKSFNGMNVSAKRHLSDRAAIRMGVSVSVQFENQSQNAADSEEDNSSSSEASDDENSQSISLDALYVRYIKPGSTVNFLWGVGPLVGFSRDRSEGTYEQTYDGSSYETRYTGFVRSWSLGALGIIGAEWFLTRSFSFHTEYRTSISYRHAYNHRTQTRTGDPAMHEEEGDSGLWRLGGGGVLLGLSVYF